MQTVELFIVCLESTRQQKLPQNMRRRYRCTNTIDALNSYNTLMDKPKREPFLQNSNASTKTDPAICRAHCAPPAAARRRSGPSVNRPYTVTGLVSLFTSHYN
ncbi:hypothetical protein EVAR_30035_1 [Eumeta japonica]|uniref:Uncharacterized protein n=1 Tax=Eumeta variegata TaxID=151549 RepID=A0A4C1VVI2_EUMVA|nr:hypothetical protein EVAR_30035_1 [Eumeta japonica]